MYFDGKKIELVNRLPVRAQIHAIFFVKTQHFCKNTKFLNGFFNVL